jgi:hypothetical protein
MCRSKPDPELNACMGHALDMLSTHLQKGGVSASAPEAAPAMARAAVEMAKTKTRPAAVSVLNRAEAVVRSLAAKAPGKAPSSTTC